MKFSALALAAITACSHAVAVPLQSRQSSYTDYLMVYFVGEHLENGEQIYFAVSNDNDAGSWTAVGDGSPALTSTVGTTGVRDPSLIRSPDGSKFFLIATDLWVHPRGWDVGDDYTENGSKGIVVWESSDLKTWSEPSLRNISPENAGMTWAPDAIWDPERSEYLVHWTCNLKGEGWFIMRSFTHDFVTFSPAEKWLTGAGMDATVVRDPASGTFHRISKNGPNELIEQASAGSLDGPWSVIRNQIGSGSIPKGEGPLVFQDNNDPERWHLWIDDFSRMRGYQAFETTNLDAAEWEPSSSPALSGSRHGYVVPITAAERSCLTGGACG
jgi:hypothetical protein